MKTAARILAATTITGCTATAFGTAAGVQPAASLSVLSPMPGQTITTTDIPAQVAVRDFTPLEFRLDQADRLVTHRSDGHEKGDVHRILDKQARGLGS